MDKIVTMLQHLIGANPPGLHCRFNLTYGRQITDRRPPFWQVRPSLDAKMQRQIEAEGANGGVPAWVAE